MKYCEDRIFSPFTSSHPSHRLTLHIFSPFISSHPSHLLTLHIFSPFTSSHPSHLLTLHTFSHSHLLTLHIGSVARTKFPTIGEFFRILLTKLFIRVYHRIDWDQVTPDKGSLSARDGSIYVGSINIFTSEIKYKAEITDGWKLVHVLINISNWEYIILAIYVNTANGLLVN